jgi:hypothetical protein
VRILVLCPKNLKAKKGCFIYIENRGTPFGYTTVVNFRFLPSAVKFNFDDVKQRSVVPN